VQVNKVHRTTSVVVEQPASDKILVDRVPDVSVNIEDVSLLMCALHTVLLFDFGYFQLAIPIADCNA